MLRIYTNLPPSYLQSSITKIVNGSKQLQSNWKSPLNLRSTITLVEQQKWTTHTSCMPVRLLSSYNLHWAVTLTTFHPLHLSPLLWAAMWECNPCAFTHSVQLLFILAREEVSPVRYGLLDYCESSASHPRGWNMCEAVELHSSHRPPKSGVHLSGGFTCFKFVVALSCWWPVIHSLLEFPLTGIVIKYLFSQTRWILVKYKCDHWALAYPNVY